jgi:hypothetical protein
MGSIYEKNSGQKSRATVPLRGCQSIVGRLGLEVDERYTERRMFGR